MRGRNPRKGWDLILQGSGTNEKSLAKASHLATLITIRVKHDCVLFGLQPGLSGSGSQPPGSQIFDLLRTVGYVGGSGFAKNSTAEGDGIKRAILGKDAW